VRSNATQSRNGGPLWLSTRGLLRRLLRLRSNGTATCARRPKADSLRLTVPSEPTRQKNHRDRVLSPWMRRRRNCSTSSQGSRGAFCICATSSQAGLANGGDRAFFLEAWNGGTYTIDRVKHRGQPVRISRAALGILGGMQPDRLREALAGADDGLAARFAYVWPDPPPISKLASEPDETMRDRRNQLIEAARRLHGLQMCVDAAREPAPGLLRLDRSALALFDELRQEAMQRARSSRGLAGGWHGKTPGRALRLALVFELLAWSVGNGPEPRAISADAMARAGGYLDYLAAMFDRTTAGLAISRDEADAAAVARHILSTRPTALNERELYRLPGWSWLRDSGRRSNALGVLADAGWIRHATRRGTRKPRGDWQISPRLWETSP
jgi:hypothetical protein